MQNMKLNTYQIPYREIKTKCTIDLNGRAKTIKLLKKQIFMSLGWVVISYI